MMKKLKLLNLLMVAMMLSIFVSCDKDDSDPESKFPGVPTGEIVEKSQRAMVLTGSDDIIDIKGKEKQDYKWWKADKSVIKYSGCGASETIDNLEGYGDVLIEMAFSPEGTIMQRVDGVVSSTGYGWEWADANKSGIIVQEVEFTFTALNESQVVYASIQKGATEECSSITALTYEVFSR